MAQTPYTDLKSQDILSAHISGVQHSVSKVEGVLNMKTAQSTGHTLNAVSDQADASLRYKIYEGTIRNWTVISAIKRNGVIVNASEYDAYPAYGAIVFKVQQQSTDIITADITYVTNDSQVIDDLQAKIFGGYFHFPGTYRTHSIGNEGDYYDLVKSSDGLTTVPSVVTAVDFVGQAATTQSVVINQGYATAVACVAGEIELFPFPVSARTTYDSMAVFFNNRAGSGSIMMGVYQSSGGKPGALIAKTILGTYTPNFWRELAFQTSDGTITLDPGFYWIARANTVMHYMDRCLNSFNSIKIGDYSQTGGMAGNFAGTSSTHPYGGLRTSGSNFATLQDLPADATTLTYSLLKRNAYCSPWIRRKWA